MLPQNLKKTTRKMSEDARISGVSLRFRNMEAKTRR